MRPFGIDFGTTNSVLAQWTGTEVEVLPIDEPPGSWANMGFNKVLPSVLGIVGGREATFGWAAKRQDGDKLAAVKRLFATDEFVQIGDQQFSVEEAAALLFGRIRTGSPGVSVDRAVVTIPANSRGIARYRTKLCAGLAGIEVPALLNEPTAAAMAFAVDATQDQNVLVFDWGGGTLDVTVLEAIGGVFIERASKGIQRNGGIDLDAALAAAIEAELPPHQWSDAQQAQFNLEVERVKILLSSQTEANLALPDGGFFPVTRELLLRAIGPRLEEVRQPILQCFDDLSISPDSIDHLLMVGGSSNIPAARDMVSEILHREPDAGVDPMTAIAEGAAIASAILAGELDMDFFVSTEHALGTIIHDESGQASFSVLIPRNHNLPAKTEGGYVPLHEGASSLLVRVIEGDPQVPVDHEDNVILKEWDVAIDPTRSKEDAAFTMTYEYDVDGILHVTVVDDLTGQVMLRDDLSFGITKDKTQLVDLAQRVRASIDTGVVGGDGTPMRPAAVGGDPEVVALVERTRKKVIPFVDDAEQQRLEAIISDLEQATGDAVGECKEALTTELRKYAYLF